MAAPARGYDRLKQRVGFNENGDLVTVGSLHDVAKDVMELMREREYLRKCLMLVDTARTQREEKKRLKAAKVLASTNSLKMAEHLVNRFTKSLFLGWAPDGSILVASNGGTGRELIQKAYIECQHIVYEQGKVRGAVREMDRARQAP